MRIRSLYPIALAGLFASITASPLHVESSPMRITASLPSAEHSTLSLHLVRTDDLLSDLDDHSILKRLTHIALRIELDEEKLVLGINGREIELKSLQKDWAGERVQAVKAEAFTLSDEFKEGFRQGEVMPQAEIVKSALEHLPKGIVSIRIAEDEVAPSTLPAGAPSEVSAGAQVSMKAFAITDVDSDSISHLSSFMVPVLRIELEYDDGEDSIVKMRHYAIQPSVRVVGADETNGLDPKIADEEIVEEIEQGRESVEGVDEDEEEGLWHSELDEENEDHEDNEDSDEDSDEDKGEFSGEDKEGKSRQPDGGKGRRPLPEGGDGRPHPPGHGGERRPEDPNHRRPASVPGHHHHHHHHGSPPPPPPAWIKWIAERLGVPPPPSPPPSHSRKPHHPHDRQDIPPFNGPSGNDDAERMELASEWRPSGFGILGGATIPGGRSHRRPEGHRHHHFGGHHHRHHGPSPFFHRLTHDLHAFFYVLGAALSTPGGRIFSFVVQGLMLILIVVKLARARRSNGSVRLEEEDVEAALVPPAPEYSVRKDETQRSLGLGEALEINFSKA
ncbi:BZ3500_MvSof-1268-A1-R1_Chr11-2g03351 [Microbotryum saponariae]|uniref:BZ3500_MvSof-1268-A1-R1_Chr11-2g03351 protein n=1 Tax=Microbotryum saponariae TaxID=289078 RepID=A0A2X0MRW3_9BASI|nr:BZ3500_MvSof-1268-A1-R1_Chr11-2g03351 [Microbotryum saponariae]SDA03182.1 BZ3501_MvSof-1269-A2-R1_Chr11g02922 [Microbotryum saponariae]